jgi:hypothetical protein
MKFQLNRLGVELKGVGDQESNINYGLRFIHKLKTGAKGLFL